MSESQRKAIYSAVVAVGAVFVAFGVWDATTQDSVQAIVQAVIGLVPVFGGLVAHLHTHPVPTAGDPPVVPTEDVTE